MRKINDNVCGTLSYNYQWERELEVSLWGQVHKLKLAIESETDEDASVSEVQRKAYQSFQAQYASLEDEILNRLIRYCKDEFGIADCAKETFLAHNRPTSIFLPLSGEWAVMFDSDYAEEEGLAAVVRDGDIEVGSQDIIL